VTSALILPAKSLKAVALEDCQFCRFPQEFCTAVCKFWRKPLMLDHFLSRMAVLLTIMLVRLSRKIEEDFGVVDIGVRAA